MPKKNIHLTFNIIAFSFTGLSHKENQDRVLVQNILFDRGNISFSGITRSLCFVADGISGKPAGEYAAEFVLSHLKKISDNLRPSEKEPLLGFLKCINDGLLVEHRNNPLIAGCASTLVGLLIDNEGFRIINCGDSPAYVYRDGLMIKLTETHTIGGCAGEPLTSYFGCQQEEFLINLDTTLREIKHNDIFLISSDGLFDALTMKHITSILSRIEHLSVKLQLLQQDALAAAAQDDVSVILVEVKNQTEFTIL